MDENSTIARRNDTKIVRRSRFRLVKKKIKIRRGRVSDGREIQHPFAKYAKSIRNGSDSYKAIKIPNSFVIALRAGSVRDGPVRE